MSVNMSVIYCNTLFRKQRNSHSVSIYWLSRWYVIGTAFCKQIKVSLDTHRSTSAFLYALLVSFLRLSCVSLASCSCLILTISKNNNALPFSCFFLNCVCNFFQSSHYCDSSCLQAFIRYKI